MIYDKARWRDCNEAMHRNGFSICNIGLRVGDIPNSMQSPFLFANNFKIIVIDEGEFPLSKRNLFHRVPQIEKRPTRKPLPGSWALTPINSLLLTMQADQGETWPTIKNPTTLAVLGYRIFGRPIISHFIFLAPIKGRELLINFGLSGRTSPLWRTFFCPSDDLFNDWFCGGGNPPGGAMLEFILSKVLMGWPTSYLLMAIGA